ncbi:hypothetical protein GN956_G16856 [Arapaima gigas]
MKANGVNPSQVRVGVLYQGPDKTRGSRVTHSETQVPSPDTLPPHGLAEASLHLSDCGSVTGLGEASTKPALQGGPAATHAGSSPPAAPADEGHSDCLDVRRTCGIQKQQLLQPGLDGDGELPELSFFCRPTARPPPRSLLSTTGKLNRRRPLPRSTAENPADWRGQAECNPPPGEAEGSRSRRLRTEPDDGRGRKPPQVNARVDTGLGGKKSGEDGRAFCPSRRNTLSPRAVVASSPQQTDRGKKFPQGRENVFICLCHVPKKPRNGRFLR